MKVANIKYLYESLLRYIDMLKKSVSDWTVCGLWLSRFLTSVKRKDKQMPENSGCGLWDTS